MRHGRVVRRLPGAPIPRPHRGDGILLHRDVPQVSAMAMATRWEKARPDVRALTDGLRRAANDWHRAPAAPARFSR